MDFLVPTDVPFQPAPIYPAAQGSQGQEHSSLCPADCLPGSPLVIGEAIRIHAPVSGAPPGFPAVGTAVQQGLLSGRGTVPHPLQVTS